MTDITATVTVTDTHGLATTRTVVVTQAVATGFPDASNTGVPSGTTLTPRGAFSSSSNGQIIEGFAVSGEITVNHSNVIVRKCSAKNISTFGAGTTIEDCTVNPNPTSNSGISLLGNNGLIQRCNVSNFENGIWVDSPTSGHIIRDNYIHDPIPYNPQADPHIDGIQMWANGIDNVLIQHNSILCSIDSSSAVTGGDANTNIRFDNNRLSGGTYTMYVLGAGSVTNNRFGIHEFGYIAGITTHTTFSGNVDDVTGAPVVP